MAMSTSLWEGYWRWRRGELDEALALWRGKDPNQAWSQARRPGISLSAADALGAGDNR